MTATNGVARAQPVVLLQPAPFSASDGGVPAFRLSLLGVHRGARVDVSIWCVAADGSGADVRLGSVAGTAVVAQPGVPSLFTLADVRFTRAAVRGSRSVIVRLPMPLTLLLSSAPFTQQTFVLPETAEDLRYGARWSVQARIEGTTIRSPVFPVEWVPLKVDRNHASYDWHDGHEVKFYHDASENAEGSRGAFNDIKVAIEGAKRLVYVVDWSFHPMMRYKPTENRNDTFGSILLNAARGGALVAIHTWDHPMIGAPDGQNDDGDELLDALAGGRRPLNMFWRASSRTGVGNTHHQKFIVVDEQLPDGRFRLRGFVGGLDLTKGRFDWSGHPIDTASFKKELWLDGDSYDDWYNGETGNDKALPRQPWHDIYACITGPVVWDLAREFVGRWNVVAESFGTQGDMGDESKTRVASHFRALLTDPAFVQQWEPHRGPFRAQVCRSIESDHWQPYDLPSPRYGRADPVEFTWDLQATFERSIQDSYVSAIAAAEKFIYVETQYLIGSGDNWDPARPGISNGIPAAIVAKIVEKIERGEDFHAYIVVPMFPEGDPIAAGVAAVRRLQWETMRYMAQSVYQKAQEKTGNGQRWQDYLSFYFPAQWSANAQVTTRGNRNARLTSNRRYMIYVHSKLMIVDDLYLINGSANLNERSLAGDRDSEICVALWPGPAQRQACREGIAAFRRSLWAEHLGNLSESQPELRSCVAAVRDLAGRNYRSFRKLQAREGQLCLIPLEADDSLFELRSDPDIPDGPLYLPDNPLDPTITVPGTNRSRIGQLIDQTLTHTLLWLWKAVGGSIFAVPGEFVEGTALPE